MSLVRFLETDVCPNDIYLFCFWGAADCLMALAMFGHSRVCCCCSSCCCCCCQRRVVFLPLLPLLLLLSSLLHLFLSLFLFPFFLLLPRLLCCSASSFRNLLVCPKGNPVLGQIAVVVSVWHFVLLSFVCTRCQICLNFLLLFLFVLQNETVVVVIVVL